MELIISIYLVSNARYVNIALPKIYHSCRFEDLFFNVFDGNNLLEDSLFSFLFQTFLTVFVRKLLSKESSRHKTTFFQKCTNEHFGS